VLCQDDARTGVLQAGVGVWVLTRRGSQCPVRESGLLSGKWRKLWGPFKTQITLAWGGAGWLRRAAETKCSRARRARRSERAERLARKKERKIYARLQACVKGALSQ
jgi:hypothetical protein